MAQKYFFNKRKLVGNFLVEVNEYIINNLMINFAQKISIEESLNERRTLLNRINPVFHEQMKFLITKYFNERNPK